MFKSLSFYKRAAWVLGAVLWSACTQNSGNVDFPLGDSEFTQPVSRPFKFGDPVTIQWDEADPNTIKPLPTKRFDLSKIPAKRFDIGYPFPLKMPLEEKTFDWNVLPDTVFDFSTLATQKLRFKTIFMQPPTIVKAGYPTVKPSTTRGVMDMGTGLVLPGNGRCFLKDHDGFQWIGTDKGLCRYDGLNLEIYGTEQGIWNTSIWSIAEDKDHRIWIGTDTGDVFVLDRKTGLILQLVDTFPRGQAYGMIQARDGQMWIVRNGDGVIIVNEKEQTIKKFSRQEGLAGNFTLSILQDRSDRVWLTTQNGATVIDAKNKKTKKIGKAQGLGENPIYGLMEDNEGNIWLGGNGGAHIINTDKGTLHRLWKDQGLIGAGFVVGLEQDRAGTVWLGTDVGAVFSFDRKKGLLEKFTVASGTSIAYSLLEDNEGQIWVGTTNGGCFAINTKRGRPGNFTPAEGLGSNAVWSVVEARDGKIWLGTANGIDIYDRPTQTIRHLSTDQGLHSNRMSHLYEDHQGQIWAFGNNDGITIINVKEGTMKYLGEAQGLSNPSIQRVYEDGQGLVWMGTFDGEVHVYNLKDRVHKKIANLATWKNDRINNLLMDRQGQIWLCSGRDGVMVIDKEYKTMKPLTASQGLLGNIAYNALESADGIFWIGTSKGINKLDLTEQTITSFTTKEGLANNEIWTLNERNGVIYAGTTRGLSMLTYTTKSNDTPASWTVTNYGKTQGLAYLDFDLNSALFTRNGEYWSGLEIEVLLVMNDPVPDSIIPTTYVTGITTLDKQSSFSDRGPVVAQLQNVDTLWKAESYGYYENKNEPVEERYAQQKQVRWDSVEQTYHLPVNLQLPYNENYLSFSFTGITLSNPDQVRYRYLLEGIDKAWSPISANTQSENYRDLPPGSYSFKVRSKGMNDVWSEPAIFSFTILPPWWKSWWAYGGYLLLFAAAGWRVHVYQKAVTVRQEREKVRERELAQAKEIEKAYNDLKATQSQLIQSEKMASLGELTAGIAHEIQNPLNFVNNFSEINKELLQEMSDELNQGRAEDAKAIAKSIMENEEKILFHGKRADSIVKGMLQHSRASSGVKEPTDINALADEYLRLAYHGLRAKDKSFNAGMKTELDPNLGKVNVVPQDLGRVILNLITNGFYAVTERKRSESNGYEPTVTVITKKAGDKVKITVKDNGNGIPQHILDKIFQPFFTTKPSGQGTGLGLSMSYDIVTKVHGGQIDVDTQPGQGTSFIITIPNQPS